MLITRLLFSALFFLINEGFAANGENEDVIKYLQDNYKYISRMLKRDAFNENGILFLKENSLILPSKNGPSQIISMLNDTFLFLEYELYHLDQKKGIISHMDNAAFVIYSSPISFIKTANYKSMGIMIVGFENGAATIYGYENNPRSFYIIHSLHLGYKLKDAKFFYKNSELYFILVTSSGNYIAPIIVYKWMNAHFDEIDKKFIDSSLSLSTFRAGNSEIILVLPNHHSGTSYVEVYEFHSDRLRKIQKLETRNQEKAFSFTRANDKYSLLYSPDSESVLFKWTGFEFIKLQEIRLGVGVQKMEVVYVDEDAFFVVAFKEYIDFYNVRKDELGILSSYKFTGAYRSIVDMDILIEDYLNTVMILGMQQGQNMTYTSMNFVIQNSPIVGSEDKIQNELFECFDTLEESLTATAEDRDDLLSAMDSAPQKLKMVQKLGESQTLDSKSPILKQEQPHNWNLQQDIDRLSAELDTLDGRLKALGPSVHRLLRPENTVFNGKLIIHGGLNGLLMNATRVWVDQLNGIKWSPEQWLSSDGKEQTVPGSVHVETATMGELSIGVPNKYFSEFGPQERVDVAVGMKSLRAHGLFATEINDIPWESVFLRLSGDKILGNKIFDDINAEEIRTDQLNKEIASEIVKLFGDPKAIKYEFTDNLQITNLKVDSINAVKWEDFTNSVFKAGMDDTIKGNIKLASVRTKHLFTNKLSGISIEALLTKNTEQTIKSNIIFDTVNAPNIITERINGLDFGSDVATATDGDTRILGPVSMKNLHVRGNMNINESFDSFINKLNTETTSGDKPLQMYNKKVIIRKDLHLQNLHLQTPAKLLISGNEFSQENIWEYWLKSTNQEIPVHLEALMGITVPHLSAKQLNNIPIGDYMVNDLSDKRPTKFIFENATVLGDVTLNDKVSHIPDLRKLDQDAVKLHGTFNIKGVKKFMGKLSVDNLKTDYINSVPTVNFRTVHSPDMSGTNSFANIIVRGNVKADSLNTQNINNINLQRLVENTIYVDIPFKIERAEFANVTVHNLTVINVNNKLLNNYIASLDELINIDVINKATIHGNCRANSLNGIMYINDINIPERIEKSKSFTGNVSFEGKVHVGKLYAQNFNGINLPELWQRLYLKQWPQLITAKHTFKILITGNLTTPMINDINIENLIDTKSEKVQKLPAGFGLQLGETVFLKSLQTSFLQCDLTNIDASLNSMPTRFWNNVDIKGNVTLLDDEGSALGRLVNHAVIKNWENIITAPVTINQAIADNIFTKKDINGVNLKEIVDDALLLNAAKQTIRGHKVFRAISATNAEVMGTAQIPIVNKLDMQLLNRSIVHKNDINNAVIRGRKTFFGGVQADNVNAPIIAGVVPEDLVSTDNLKPVNQVTFSSLQVAGDFDIGFVNNENFSEFLADRLLLNTPQEQVIDAIYYLEEMQLDGPSTIPKINNIPMDDVVFDEDVQIITSPKNFKTIDVYNDVAIESINNFDFAHFFDNAVLKNTEATIEGNLCFKDVANITGDIIAENINDIPIGDIQEQLHTENTQIQVNSVRETIKKIETLIGESVSIVKNLPNQYLYLDRSDRLYGPVLNSVDAQIIRMQDNLMIHVKVEESGEACGLIGTCACPSQETMMISSEYSVHPIENKLRERVFSYQDEATTIHIVTNTYSTSSICRSNSTQDVTKITLNSTVLPLSDAVKGYVSDVKFFTVDREIYSVLCRYYDAILDTHELDCLIMHFPKETGTIEYVQKIPTVGAWTVHVFYTAQGLNLVIGSKDDIVVPITTGIYRFNPVKKQFNLLRTVTSTGCLAATSIVLDYDSLIVLANSKSPIQVLKYDSVADNYYFYKHFIYDTPVISATVFYTGGAGISDAYLAMVTDHNNFLVYSYQYVSGFKLESEGHVDGLKGLVYFSYMGTPYLFAPSINGSTFLTIVSHGETTQKCVT